MIPAGVKDIHCDTGLCQVLLQRLCAHAAIVIQPQVRGDVVKSNAAHTRLLLRRQKRRERPMTVKSVAA